MIDKSSPIPIYYQIEEQIKALIESGKLKSGDCLPSEREYAEKFKVSRMTVRQAINNLVNDGFLYREKGKGTFVAQKKFEQVLHGLTSFTEDMKARGLTPGNRIFSFELLFANELIAKQLDMTVRDPVYQIERIRLADNEPIALETSFISANLIKDLTKEAMHQSLYNYIEEELNLRIDYSTQEIEAAPAGDKEAEALGIKKGTPILKILRKSYLEDGKPFEMVKSAYLADRYKFIATMKRSTK
ncbi:GntR family transcriptional regulator [Litchfieldia alkalitelluris]|uniref:GntR family transcriptional regulator n=1 Tax=Litchfieldia alkalitelluris TaxID=304268 RepID=UPI00099635A0|nr:GntR family transcriptional regulator [Litchfieldia alkalitelluris]